MPLVLQVLPCSRSTALSLRLDCDTRARYADPRDLLPIVRDEIEECPYTLPLIFLLLDSPESMTIRAGSIEEKSVTYSVEDELA